MHQRITLTLTLVLILEAGFIPNVAAATSAQALLKMSNYRTKVYYQPGDILIGVLTVMSGTDDYITCNSQLGWNVSPMNTEAIPFAVNIVNADDTILHNITLGFVVLDTCYSDITSVAAATFFLGANVKVETTNGNDTCQLASCSNSCMSDSCSGDADGAMPLWDVTAVIGPAASSHATTAVPLLNAAHIPVLGISPTSDILDNRADYPLFARLIQPDRYQVQAMMDILEYFGWTYISFIYSDDSYGLNAAAQMEVQMKLRGVCMAVTYKLSSADNEVSIRQLINKLVANRNARIIVLFAQNVLTDLLLHAMTDLDIINEFLFLSGDYISQFIYQRVLNGMLFIHFSNYVIPSFAEYLSQQTPDHHSQNPWLELAWSLGTGGCPWNPLTASSSSPSSATSQPFNITRDADATTASRCSQFTSLASLPADYQVTAFSTGNYNAVHVLAHAMHNLITDHCPGATGSAARHCLKVNDLYSYIINVTIPGEEGDEIRFDAEGNVLSSYYVIKQFRQDPATGNYVIINVGKWFRLNTSLSMDQSALSFQNYDVVAAASRSSGSNASQELFVPESVCSKPCGARQATVRRDLSCCWDCNACRSDEIIVNGTSCVACPPNTWPDDVTATVCLPIPPDVFSAGPVAKALVAIATVVLVAIAAVGALFVKHRRTRIIKATSFTHSMLMLAATALACVGVYVTCSAPASDVICGISDAIFHMSICLLFAPLLVKNVRVYRIFAAGKKGLVHPRFVSGKIQILFIAIPVLIEAALIAISDVTNMPRAEQVMPVATERYVELTCVQPPVGFIVPLTFNLCIMAACTVLAGFCRKLPENFKESWYIFVSSSTTLFMLAVLVPSYFSATRGAQKAAILTFCLVLVSTVTLLCQYIPRLYAIYYVSDTAMHLAPPTNANNASNAVTSQHNAIGHLSNKRSSVAPHSGQMD